MRLIEQRGYLLFLIGMILVGVGGAVAAEDQDDFTVVLLPDTQNYSDSRPGIYLSQTGWIQSRAAPDNIRFVIHLGDIVDHAEKEEEWERADRAHRVLDGAVPYSVLPGNHDMDGRDTTLYNKYFPPERFEQHAWYGGHLGKGNDNNYCFFQGAGMEFMVLSLENDPGDATLEWADRVLAEHTDRRVIVATHSYLDRKNRKSTGDRIWEKLIRKHENVFLVVSGHVKGTNHQTSTNDAGDPVHEILCDYQGFPNGGDGWLETLRFVPRENKIHVEAYSPLLDEHNQEPDQTYSLEYPMSPVEVKEAA